DSAEPLLGRRDHRLPVVLVGNIMTDKHRRFTDFFRNRPAPVLVQIGERNPSPLACQGQCILLAYAAGSAGDYYDLSFNPSHGFLRSGARFCLLADRRHPCSGASCAAPRPDAVRERETAYVVVRCNTHRGAPGSIEPRDRVAVAVSHRAGGFIDAQSSK